MHRLFHWGLVLLLLALGGAVFEIAAQQPPSSGAHLGIPAGPVTLFKQQCAFFGALLMLLELRGHHRDRSFSLTLLTGIGITTFAQSGAAIHGFYGVSPADFRPEAQAVFWFRVAGHGILAVCLLWLMKREWRSEWRNGVGS